MGADAVIVSAVHRLRDRTGLPIQRAFLFGSRARGEAGPHSDVDLLLVSPAFEGKSASQRAAQLYLAWDLDLPVDFLCYSPGEFEGLRRRATIVQIVLREGVEIAM
jgi:uncharacterized protein